MGVAAKSNVEKRQVGCIIVDSVDNSIKGEGFNHVAEKDSSMGPIGLVDVHAEHAAIVDMQNKGAVHVDGDRYIAYVTHPPCPRCAKELTDFGVTKVVVVEAFMKFDGDKVRFDLISGVFALKCFKDQDSWNHDRVASGIKTALWLYEAEATAIDDVIMLHCGFYKDFYHMEEALAKVLTFGASKYKPNNWKACSDTGRYLAAAHRHLNAVIKGEQLDPETGLHHLDHVMCNLMFLSELGLK
tara:strand:- start:6367 stop:7092 length:726 start_codon:yes stop_codon:yes gene_type:complete